MNKEQEKKGNSEIIQSKVIRDAANKGITRIFVIFLQGPILCFSLGTHEAFYPDPKEESESVRNIEKALNTDRKYDEERREPKKIRDDHCELVVALIAVEERKSAGDNCRNLD